MVLRALKAGRGGAGQRPRPGRQWCRGRVFRRADHPPGGAATLALRTGAALLPGGQCRPRELAHWGCAAASRYDSDELRCGPKRWHASRKSWRPVLKPSSFGARPSSGTSTSPIGRAIGPSMPEDRLPEDPLPESEVMRIAMLSPYSLSRPGGVQGQVLGLSRALRRLGHHVTVLGPDDDVVKDTFIGHPMAGEKGPRKNSSPTMCSWWAARPASVPTGRRHRSPFHFSGRHRAERFVRKGEFDVLHIHEPLAPVTPYGFILGPRRCPWWAPTTASRQPLGAHPQALGQAGRLSHADPSGRVRGVSRHGPAFEWRRIRGALQRRRHGAVRPGGTDADGRPTVLFLGRHEIARASACCWTPSLAGSTGRAVGGRGRAAERGAAAPAS